MRILHCIPDLNGGGAERQLCYVAKGLVELGHRVDVAIMAGGVNSARLRGTGATVHTLGWRGPFSPELLLDLCRVIRASRADVVQTWLRRMDVLGGAAARLMGRPWVFSERLVKVGQPGWRETLRHLMVGLATAVVANSEEGARSWQEALGPRKVVHVIPNALPLDEIAAALPTTRADWQLPPDAEVILYAGRFDPQKNIGLLGDVLMEVLGARPRAHAICCGVGELLDPFRARMAARGLAGRCRIPGYCTDVWALMKLADVFISTSDYEGRPNVLLEAMACGTPLAVTGIPQHKEFLTAAAAVFFPAGDRAAAVAAVHGVLDDRAAALTRAARAAKLVEPMSIPTMARAYDRLYSSLCERGG